MLFIREAFLIYTAKDSGNIDSRPLAKGCEVFLEPNLAGFLTLTWIIGLAER